LIDKKYEMKSKLDILVMYPNYERLDLRKYIFFMIITKIKTANPRI